MEELDKIDKKIRNIALILIFIAVLLLVIWVLCYLNSPEKAPPLLVAIGIALLLGGILLFTRIQYVIWMKKRI
ncbi:MAG: hypothetical protein ACFFA6_15765 [Promethearchaeota archaeon]